MENQQQFNYNNINRNTMQDPNQNQGAGSQYQQHLNTGSSPQQNQFQNQSVGVARGQYDAQDRFINMTSPSHKYVKEHPESDSFRAFAGKVFMGADGIVTLEDCRWKLETLFEEHFKPERDFIDYLAVKKGRHYEQFFEKAKEASSEKGQTETDQARERLHSQQEPQRSSLVDDQDLRPMDLEAEQLMNQQAQGRASGPYQPDRGQRQEARRPLEEEKSSGQTGRDNGDEQGTYVSYIERCKGVGRVGPKVAALDPKSAYGEVIFSGRDNLDVEAVSSFASIRANAAVFSGRYYYEVQLKTAGLMQVGWSTVQTPFNSQRGVGDDSTSYAYDGCRIKKWNRDNLAYGEAWSVGDIIGTLIDFDRKVIQFWRTQKSLGRAFTGIKTGPNCVYFPAISLQRGQRVAFNFGAQPLAVSPNQLYALVEEPDAEINNHKAVCSTIVDFLKSYLITFWEFPKVPIDERLAVGSMLIEYLFPLVLDDYLMEEQLLQFMYEVTMIKKPELKNLILDLFEMHLSTDQLKVFVQKFMKHSTKKILNSEILVNQGGRPTKKDFDMTYFQLLLDLLERDEFLYAWIVSDAFFQDLEAIFEMHMPSQTDWDTYLSPSYHEYLPGSQDHSARFLKNYWRAQSGLKFTQSYWVQLTGLLMDRRKRCITTTDHKKAPADRFKDFLHHLACKNTKRNNQNQNDLLHGQQPNAPAGLNNNYMLTNVFACCTNFLDQTLLSKPVSCFPFHCLFMRDGYDFDESLKRMDRIGGSFTHLEGELGDHLKPFKGLRLTDEEKESFLFAKDLLLLFIYGILPELEKYTLALDQMYLSHRKLLDLTAKGKIEKSSEICNEMHKIVRTKLSLWRFAFQNELVRDMMIRYSIWLLQLVNYLDQAFPDLVYMLPDHVIQIPFEVLRMIKRESQLMVASGMPVSAATGSGGPEAGLEDGTQIDSQSQPLLSGSSLVNQGAGGELEGLLPTRKASEQEGIFFSELVTFISRHFIDDRIANPDLKEIYLVRLNILLQHNQFIKLFEAQEFAQEHLILMLMKSFQKNINLRHVTKNILRLAKGQGFKEIIYEEKVEKTASPYFLYKLRMQLLSLDHKVTKDFMNSFFNSLNDITSELFITFKELKDNYSGMALRKTKSYFETSIDLLRMCELFATWCPELFLDVEHVHSSRLLNFIMFTLNSVFIGEVDKHITYFSDKVYSHSATLEQYLAPIIGILVNLCMGMKQYQSEASTEVARNMRSKYETLESLFQKTDAFNERGLTLFTKLKEAVWEKLEAESTQSELAFIKRYDQMLEELELLIRAKEAQPQRGSQGTRGSASKSQRPGATGGLPGAGGDGGLHGEQHQDGGGGGPPVVLGGQLVDEAEFTDENLCQICCFQQQDTEFVPCQHQTCKKCIQTHMLNSEKCPFCNAEITSLKGIE